MWKDWVNYYRDNPQGLWFKPKLFGWGWTPVKWQGWMVILVYVTALVKLFILFDLQSHSGSDTLINMFIPFVLLTSLLIYICYKKGGKPKWQWGVPKQ